MGYELNKLMNLYGVSSPTLAYSGTAKPVKPTELATTASEADRQKYNDLLAKYNKDTPQYEADRAAYDKYKAEYQMRLEKTPMYGQKQFNTLANIAPQPNLGQQTTQGQTAANPEQMVKNAYASIGRSGLGGAATQIDPEGYNYWLNQLNTGAIKPDDFARTFQGTVAKYLNDKPEDKYTQHINQFRNMQENGTYWSDPLKAPTYPVPLNNQQNVGQQPANNQLPQTNLPTVVNPVGMPSLPDLNYTNPNPDTASPYPNNSIYNLSKKYSNVDLYAKGGAVKKYAEGGEVEDDSEQPQVAIRGSYVPSRSEMYLKLAAALAAPTKVRGMSETLSNAARAIGEFKQAEREGAAKDEMAAQAIAMQNLQQQKIKAELEKRKREAEYRQKLAEILSSPQGNQPQGSLPNTGAQVTPNTDLPEYTGAPPSAELTDEPNIPFATVSQTRPVAPQPAVNQQPSPQAPSDGSPMLRGQAIQQEINRLKNVIQRLDNAKLTNADGAPASEEFRKQLTDLYKSMPRYSLNTHTVSKDGKNLVTLIGDDSSIVETPYTPVKSITFQDVGNKVLGKDTLTGKTVSVDEKGQTPDTTARINERSSRGIGLEIDPSVLIDDDTATVLAQQALTGDTSVYTGLDKRSRLKVRSEVAKLAKQQGLNGADLAALGAEYQGTKASQRAVGTKLANTEMAVQEALNLMPIALEASALVKRSGFLPWGKLEMMFNDQTNDPQYRQFVAANNSLVNTYARAISPTGTGTERDKEHARKMLAEVYDDKSYIATVKTMQKEMLAALAAPAHVKESISKGVRGTTQKKEDENKYEGFKLIGVK